MGRIPEEKRLKVIAEIYRRADRIDWDGLQSADRTIWYSRWLEDDEIGGVLDAYMTRDQARLWIKDMPMKHYNRARSGIGPYKDLVSSHLPDAPKLTQLVLGEDWNVIPKTLQDKPNRCVVSDGQRRVRIIWGPPRTFQSLIWAALNAIVDGTETPMILVVSRQGERLTEGQIARHRKMGNLLDVDVHHVTAGMVPGIEEAR
jgi:hypothetical protein